MICLQTHTHTHTDRYLPPHAQKHTRACVRAPRHGSCILLFLSLSVLSLIWFPLGKTSLAWRDLIWPACHSYFSFFFLPPYLDCLVNLPADGLVGCWQAGYCGWQAEKLPGWMMSDSRWMNDWRQGSSRLRLMKSFFYLENQGGKLLPATMSLIELWPHQQSIFLSFHCFKAFLLTSNIIFECAIWNISPFITLKEGRMYRNGIGSSMRDSKSKNMVGGCVCII